MLSAFYIKCQNGVFLSRARKDLLDDLFLNLVCLCLILIKPGLRDIPFYWFFFVGYVLRNCYRTCNRNRYAIEEIFYTKEGGVEIKYLDFWLLKEISCQLGDVALLDVKYASRGSQGWSNSLSKLILRVGEQKIKVFDTPEGFTNTHIICIELTQSNPSGREKRDLRFYRKFVSENMVRRINFFLKLDQGVDKT